MMQARRLPGPPGWRERGACHHEQPRARRGGAWRRNGRRPSVGPTGQVRWWERPAPGGDELLWAAVVRCHEAMRAEGLTIAQLARRLASTGRPLRRETLSRVLNGRQRTSWATVERLADVLGIDIDES